MKKPMLLTIADLAKISAECAEMGVDFSWYMRPSAKDDDEVKETPENEDKGSDE